MTISRRQFGGMVAAGVAAFCPAVARAQTFPTRPVRLVVPFAPGGGADIVARLLAVHIPSTLGQSSYVENRAGAAGRIGTALVAKSEPDGHTLLVTTESSLAIAPHLADNIGYDPLKDFAPVSLLTRNTVMLVVHPSLPVNNLREYIALAKAKPGELFYASSGVGGPNHLAAEIFNRLAGVRVTHVPFQGTGLAIQAVLANQVGSMWGFTAGVIPFVREGKLRAIAVGSRERSAVLPDVPTVEEEGIAGYETSSWVGMAAPAGTPDGVIDRLWGAVDLAMKEPTARDSLSGGGSEIVVSRPDMFRTQIARDYEKVARIADLLKGKSAP